MRSFKIVLVARSSNIQPVYLAS